MLVGCASGPRPDPVPPSAAPPPPPPLLPPLPDPEPAASLEGRGPEAVREQLLREHPQRAGIIAGLRIGEDDGAVTLAGVVPDERTCHELLASAKHVRGVRTARNDLIVLERPTPVGPAASRTGDAIRSWLRREAPEAFGPDGGVEVYERDGFVRLSGKVGDERTRRELVGRVKQLPDVTVVEDRLEVHAGAQAVPPPESRPAAADGAAPGPAARTGAGAAPVTAARPAAPARKRASR
jgi:osmotically-inducible protein OsmY